MQPRVPLASHEVRWFFDGASADHPSLAEWFETTDPFEKGPNVPDPVWKQRLDDQPDLYLLARGADGAWRRERL